MAAQDFKKNDFVIEYKGKVMYTKNKENIDWNDRYIHKINDKWIISGRMVGNEAVWINHDCKPKANLRSEIWEVNKEKRIIMTANRNISIGEHLTFDYSNGYGLKGFTCSVKNCDRHKIKQ